MRKLFFDELSRYMHLNSDIWFLTGDLGYSFVEDIQKAFPHRFINCGASEQAMMDMAVGLALKNQIPFVYSITPFLLYRPFEAIRIYLNNEKIPVKLIGVGRKREYQGLGFTHWSLDDKSIMKRMKNIKSHWATKKNVRSLVRKAVNDNSPYYINLSKT